MLKHCKVLVSQFTKSACPWFAKKSKKVLAKRASFALLQILQLAIHHSYKKQTIIVKHNTWCQLEEIIGSVVYYEYM